MATTVLFSCKQVEKAEGQTAEMEAAQMMGRQAAKSLVTKKWTDTTQLNTYIDTLNSQRARFLYGKQPSDYAAYDSAYIRTVRAVDPDMADRIQRRLKAR